MCNLYAITSVYHRQISIQSLWPFRRFFRATSSSSSFSFVCCASHLPVPAKSISHFLYCFLPPTQTSSPPLPPPLPPPASHTQNIPLRLWRSPLWPARPWVKRHTTKREGERPADRMCIAFRHIKLRELFPVHWEANWTKANIFWSNGLSTVCIYAAAPENKNKHWIGPAGWMNATIWKAW